MHTIGLTVATGHRRHLQSLAGHAATSVQPGKRRWGVRLVHRGRVQRDLHFNGAVAVVTAQHFHVQIVPRSLRHHDGLGKGTHDCPGALVVRHDLDRRRGVLLRPRGRAYTQLIQTHAQTSVQPGRLVHRGFDRVVAPVGDVVGLHVAILYHGNPGLGTHVEAGAKRTAASFFKTKFQGFDDRGGRRRRLHKHRDRHVGSTDVGTREGDGDAADATARAAILDGGER